MEEALLTADGVAEVAVVGEADAEWGENVVAFIVAQPGADVTEAALDAHFKTPHMATWRSHWPAFGVSDRRLFAYEIASERQL